MSELQRDKIYEYIIQEITHGNLLPGAHLDSQKIAKELSVSKTPLRETLIKLEAEGFLTIYPRSKVVINKLDIDDIAYLFETIGALESMLIMKGINLYTKDIIAQMYQLDTQMRTALESEDYTLFKQFHADFHTMFLHLDPNPFVERILAPIKKRLWGMPPKRIPKQWLLDACDEHVEIIKAIEQKNARQAADCIKDKHWNFEYNKEYITRTFF